MSSAALAGVPGRILGEETDLFENGSPEDRVRSGAGRASRQSRLDPGALEHAPREPSAEPTVQLEQVLSRRLKLARAHVAGHGHREVVVELPGELVEPVRIDDAVIVSERDKLSGRVDDSAVRALD